MSDPVSIQKSFLLMGRSGNGINLLVNSILFKSQGDFADKGDFGITAPGVTAQGVTAQGGTAQCVTAQGGIDVGVTACDDDALRVCGDMACYKIKVGDDDYNINTNFLSQKLVWAFNCCTQGITAVLIVLKYGVRFTKQEKDAISLIKYLLGEDCIRNYGIIVFTYGDNFDLDHEVGDNHTNFSAWCREQRGDIQSLFDEVKYRCVIFDNKTTDENKKKLQREQLLKQRDTLKCGFFTRLLFCEYLVCVSKVELESLKKIADIENFKFEANFLWRKLETLERLLGEKPVDQRANRLHEEKKKLITNLIELHLRTEKKNRE